MIPTWSIEDQGSAVLNLRVQCSFDEILETIFGFRSTFQSKLQQARGNQNFVALPWLPDPAQLPTERFTWTPPDKPSQFAANACRKVRFDTPATSVMKAFQNEEVQVVQELTPAQSALIIAGVVTTAPYGDCLTTLLKYSFEAMGPSACHLEVRYRVQFLKPVNMVVKGIIMRGVEGGVKAAFDKLHSVLAETVPCQPMDKPAFTLQPPAGLPPVVTNMEDKPGRRQSAGKARPTGLITAGTVLSVWQSRLVDARLVGCWAQIVSWLQLHAVRTTSTPSHPGSPSKAHGHTNGAANNAAPGSPKKQSTLSNGKKRFAHARALMTTEQAQLHDKFRRLDPKVCAKVMSLLLIWLLLRLFFSVVRSMQLACVNRAPHFWLRLPCWIISDAVRLPSGMADVWGAAAALTCVNLVLLGMSHITIRVIRSYVPMFASAAGQPTSPLATSPTRAKMVRKLSVGRHGKTAAQGLGTRRSHSVTEAELQGSGLGSPVPRTASEQEQITETLQQLALLGSTAGTAVLAAASTTWSRVYSLTQDSSTSDSFTTFFTGGWSSQQKTEMDQHGDNTSDSQTGPSSGVVSKQESFVAELLEKDINIIENYTPDVKEPEPTEVVEEVFENERRQAWGWGSNWPGHFLPSDRVSRYSDRSGKTNQQFELVAPKLPDGWKWQEAEWKIDLTGKDADMVDKDGWSYAIDFWAMKHPPPPGSGGAKGRCARRRRWIRTRVKCDGTEGTTLLAAANGVLGSDAKGPAENSAVETSPEVSQGNEVAKQTDKQKEATQADKLPVPPVPPAGPQLSFGSRTVSESAMASTGTVEEELDLQIVRRRNVSWSGERYTEGGVAAEMRVQTGSVDMGSGGWETWWGKSGSGEGVEGLRRRGETGVEVPEDLPKQKSSRERDANSQSRSSSPQLQQESQQSFSAIAAPISRTATWARKQLESGGLGGLLSTLSSGSWILDGPMSDDDEVTSTPSKPVPDPNAPSPAKHVASPDSQTAPKPVGSQAASPLPPSSKAASQTVSPRPPQPPSTTQKRSTPATDTLMQSSPAGDHATGHGAVSAQSEEALNISTQVAKDAETAISLGDQVHALVTNDATEAAHQLLAAGTRTQVVGEHSSKHDADTTPQLVAEICEQLELDTSPQLLAGFSIVTETITQSVPLMQVKSKPVLKNTPPVDQVLPDLGVAGKSRSLDSRHAVPATGQALSSVRQADSDLKSAGYETELQDTQSPAVDAQTPSAALMAEESTSSRVTGNTSDLTGATAGSMSASETINPIYSNQTATSAQAGPGSQPGGQEQAVVAVATVIAAAGEEPVAKLEQDRRGDPACTVAAEGGQAGHASSTAPQVRPQAVPDAATPGVSEAGEDLETADERSEFLASIEDIAAAELQEVGRYVADHAPSQSGAVHVSPLPCLQLPDTIASLLEPTDETPVGTSLVEVSGGLLPASEAREDSSLSDTGPSIQSPPDLPSQTASKGSSLSNTGPATPAPPTSSSQTVTKDTKQGASPASLTASITSTFTMSKWAFGSGQKTTPSSTPPDSKPSPRTPSAQTQAPPPQQGAAPSPTTAQARTTGVSPNSTLTSAPRTLSSSNPSGAPLASTTQTPGSSTAPPPVTLAHAPGQPTTAQPPFPFHETPPNSPPTGGTPVPNGPSPQTTQSGPSPAAAWLSSTMSGLSRGELERGLEKGLESMKESGRHSWQKIVAVTERSKAALSRSSVKPVKGEESSDGLHSRANSEAAARGGAGTAGTAGQSGLSRTVMTLGPLAAGLESTAGRGLISPVVSPPSTHRPASASEDVAQQEAAPSTQKTAADAGGMDATSAQRGVASGSAVTEKGSSVEVTTDLSAGGGQDAGIVSDVGSEDPGVRKDELLPALVQSNSPQQLKPKSHGLEAGRGSGSISLPAGHDKSIADVGTVGAGGTAAGLSGTVQPPAGSGGVQGSAANDDSEHSSGFVLTPQKGLEAGYSPHSSASTNAGPLTSSMLNLGVSLLGDSPGGSSTSPLSASLASSLEAAQVGWTKLLAATGASMKRRSSNGNEEQNAP